MVSILNRYSTSSRCTGAQQIYILSVQILEGLRSPGAPETKEDSSVSEVTRLDLALNFKLVPLLVSELLEERKMPTISLSNLINRKMKYLYLNCTKIHYYFSHTKHHVVVIMRFISTACSCCHHKKKCPNRSKIIPRAAPS